MQDLTAFENTVLGMAAGAGHMVFVQPMIYWKDARQQRWGFTMQPSVVYRGLAVSAAQVGACTAVAFLSTGLIRSALTGGERAPRPEEQLMSAWLGGALSGVIAGPLQLLMIQQQAHGGSLADTAARVLRTSGPRGFARGAGACMLREGAYTSALLGLVPLFGQALHTVREGGGSSSSSASPGTVAVASLLAGLTAAAVSHPADTVKSCLQGDLEGMRYRTNGTTVRALLAEGGFLRLYDGLLWRCGVIVAACYATSEISRMLLPVFFPHHAKAQRGR